MPSSNLFQQTTNIHCSPTQALQGDDEESIETILSIAELNFVTIRNFVDGSASTDPHFFTKPQNRDVKVTQALTILHNYLATIYSYNENLTAILSDYLPSNSDCPSTTDLAGCFREQSRSQYMKKFNFILGLRTDAQHGTFSGFDVTRMPWDSMKMKHHVKFDRDGFVNTSRLGDMSTHLNFTNSREREYIITFLAKFHTNTLQQFHDDLMDWFSQHS